jgi:SAM-dependent methyltransferase
LGANVVYLATWRAEESRQQSEVLVMAARPDTLSATVSQDPSNFRFYDNRQKYLMFVNTCSEKWMVAERTAKELALLAPSPPALRFFDAGMGDGTVLSRVMRAMHAQFPRVPFYVAGKEISLEDVRLTLDKMPDRLFEHPEAVLAITNISYSEAPWLVPSKPEARARMVWKTVPLKGNTTAGFEQQMLELQPLLAANWRTRVSEKTGSLVPETPTTLILYREDHAFLLDSVIPKRDAACADFDLVLASQPFRLRAPTEFKAKRVLAPLARALRPGGRLLGIHSAGNDPGLEIIQRVWPKEDPFTSSRRELIEATRAALGEVASEFRFDTLTNAQSLFRYEMHTLPDEIDGDVGTIGTSTLLAAWNAATYVAQIEDERLVAAMSNSAYLDATRAVLRKNGELWFNDESYVIARKPASARAHLPEGEPS